MSPRGVVSHLRADYILGDIKRTGGPSIPPAEFSGPDQIKEKRTHHARDYTHAYLDLRLQRRQFLVRTGLFLGLAALPDGRCGPTQKSQRPRVFSRGRRPSTFQRGRDMIHMAAFYLASHPKPVRERSSAIGRDSTRIPSCASARMKRRTKQKSSRPLQNISVQVRGTSRSRIARRWGWPVVWRTDASAGSGDPDDDPRSLLD